MESNFPRTVDTLKEDARRHLMITLVRSTIGQLSMDIQLEETSRVIYRLSKLIFDSC